MKRAGRPRREPLQRVSWDDALDDIASRIKQAIARSATTR